MAISSVSITGLFGYFNHEIRLKIRDRITIIHGPNGVGKTTVLRLLQDLFFLRLHAIRRIPFGKIVIRFLPKGTLTIVRENVNAKQSLPYLRLTYRCGKEKVEHTVERLKERDLRRRFPLSIFERIIDQLERVGPEEWLDRSTDSILSIEDILLKYGNLLPEEFRSLKEAVPSRLQAILKETNVYLIETQRLFTKSPLEKYDPRIGRREMRERMTVEEYSMPIRMSHTTQEGSGLRWDPRSAGPSSLKFTG